MVVTSYTRQICEHAKDGIQGTKTVSYVSRSMIQAENETLKNLITAMTCLCDGADEVFRTLASLPREQVTEAIKKMV